MSSLLPALPPPPGPTSAPARPGRIPADHGASMFHGDVRITALPTRPRSVPGSSFMPGGPEVDTSNTTLSQYG